MFSKQYEIRYNEVDKFYQATLPTIMNYLEDSAISHSSSVGLGVHELKSRGLGWVLNRWVLSVEKYPMLGEKVVVETWPSSFERFYGNREFFIKDGTDSIIARAFSVWIFFDLNKRRPVRIPPEFGDSYGINSERALKQPFKIQDEFFKAEYSCNFTVRRCDIDTNSHVNNVRYVEWLLETLPVSTYDNKKVNFFIIEYKKETTLGSCISSSCMSLSAEAPDSQFLHVISQRDSGTALAVARTAWR